MPEPATIPPLTESLEHVHFPIQKEELLDQYGDTLVQLEEGQVLSLTQALSCIIQSEFISVSDIAMAIKQYIPTGNWRG